MQITVWLRVRRTPGYVKQIQIKFKSFALQKYVSAFMHVRMHN